MEKSFGDILTDSFATFKKSFLPVLGIYAAIGGAIFVLIIIVAIVTILTVGINGIQNAQNMHSIMKTAPFLVEFILFFVAIVFIGYLMYACTMLVIRNNILVGKSFFKESFFEAMRKFFKTAFLFILIGVALALIFAVVASLSYFTSKYFLFLLLLLLPLGIIVGPSLMMSFYGVLYREGNFWDIVSKSFSLGFANWGRIFGYSFLFACCYMGIIVAIALGISAFDGTGVEKLLGAIFSLFQFCMSIFSYCFYTVFYLDLAGIKPQQSENLIETNQVNQINQSQIMP